MPLAPLSWSTTRSPTARLRRAGARWSSLTRSSLAMSAPSCWYALYRHTYLFFVSIYISFIPLLFILVTYVHTHAQAPNSDTRIAGCVFENNYTAVRIEDPKAVTLEKNTFRSSSVCAIHMHCNGPLDPVRVPSLSSFFFFYLSISLCLHCF